MNNTLKTASKFLCALVISLPLSFVGAQEAQETNKEVEAVATPSEDIEIIGVTGEKPLAFFKLEMERAELDFYDAYNAIADDDKFRIKCRIEKRLGSNIKSRVCYPQFVIDRMVEETQDALSSGYRYPNLEEIEFAVRDERAESMKYVEKVVTENPQLLEKLIALNEKQNRYAAKKGEK